MSAGAYIDNGHCGLATLRPIRATPLACITVKNSLDQVAPPVNFNAPPAPSLSYFIPVFKLALVVSVTWIMCLSSEALKYNWPNEPVEVDEPLMLPATSKFPLVTSTFFDASIVIAVLPSPVPKNMLSLANIIADVPPPFWIFNLSDPSTNISAGLTALPSNLIPLVDAVPSWLT